MLGFAHFLAEAIVPSLVAAIGLSVAWRYVPPGAMRTGLQIVGSLLFFVPPLLSLFFANYSVDLVFCKQVTLALVGASGLVVLLRKLRGVMLAGRSGGGSSLVEGVMSWRTTDAERRSTRARLAAVRGLGNRHPVKTTIAAVFMSILFFYASWQIVGDFVLPRSIVVGTVTGARYHASYRTPGWYEVSIGGQTFTITRDLLAQLRPMERVALFVGRGSGTVFAVKELPK